MPFGFARGELRLRSEDRFALLTAALCMTGIILVPPGCNDAAEERVGMLRLRSEDRFALLTAPLSMTLAIGHPRIVSAFVLLSEAARLLRGVVEGSLPVAWTAASTLDSR